MPKGGYLTKDPYGEPANEYERAAKEWLLQHNGTEGQDVMQSLAALIRKVIEIQSDESPF